MSAIEHVLAANGRFAAEYAMGPMSPVPRRKLAVVACMDARIDPPRALGLDPGDAHIIRNAGGRVVDALRSLAISQQMLGTEEVAIIHHTGCGMLAFTDDEIRRRLHENLNARADKVGFLTYADIEEGLRADLRAYAESPIVRHDIPVHGFIYEVETGRLRMAG